MSEVQKIQIVPSPEEEAALHREVILRGLIALGIMALPILMYDQRVKITLKAWWRKLQIMVESYIDADLAGERFVEWLVRRDGPSVIAEAEDITREEHDRG